MIKKTVIALGLAVILIFALLGCQEDHKSIFEWPYTSKPTPKITGVEPAEGTFAGVGKTVINGLNFSPIAAENHVFFGGKEGVTLSATETELRVQCPNVVNDSNEVKVRVDGAFELYNYTETDKKTYKLISAIHSYKAVTKELDIKSITVDKDENVYIMYFVGTNGTIARLTHPDSANAKPFGTVSLPFPKTIKAGPGGNLYIAKANNIIYFIPPTGGAAAIFTKVRAKEKVSYFDFDEYGNMYAGGDSWRIFRIRPDKDTLMVAGYDSMAIRDIRVYNGYLYTLTKYSGKLTTPVQDGIFRHQILNNNGQLGPAELVFNWRTYIGKSGSAINAITFDSEGKMYLGLESGNAISLLDLNTMEVIVHYEEILSNPVTNFQWGNGKYLYINSYILNADQTLKAVIYRVNMQVDGAPNYGRDL